MPKLSNAMLSVNTDKSHDRATVRVTCDIEFSEVEVNAMNILGLRYALHCTIMNKELLDEDAVTKFHHVKFPRVAGAAYRYEHAEFETTEPMEMLHDRLLGKDQLLAELKLKNEETGTEDVLRTDTIGVDLVA
jgi:hypothetical protein